MSVCGSCGTKGQSGYTVDGCIAAGDNMYQQGNYSDARGWYQKALNILDFYNGCSSCKYYIQSKINMC